MSRPATSRLKVNPPLGMMPALQYLLPAQLEIDATYQRNLDTGPSQSLIRKIAMFWNWDLCQPLVVARRDDGRLFVIDGQHRLEAARLRGDIAQLPAVVVQYASAADEAASFVHLNQQRRPLSKLDVFKAALASGDAETAAIVAALTENGLSIAGTTNHKFWKPGQLVNIGGIERSWRTHGPDVTSTALRSLSQAWAGTIFQYAGTAFTGIAAVCAAEMPRGKAFPHDRLERFIAMLGRRKLADWRSDIMRARGEDPNLTMPKASEVVLRKAWARENGVEPASPAFAAAAKLAAPIASSLAQYSGSRWCDQCEMKITHDQATGCKSRWCSLRKFG